MVQRKKSMKVLKKERFGDPEDRRNDLFLKVMK